MGFARGIFIKNVKKLDKGGRKVLTLQLESEGHEMKDTKISYWASHLTTVVSVTLVLIIIGSIALISVCASRESRAIRENVELTAVFTDASTDSAAQAVFQKVKALPEVKDATFMTRQQVMQMMNEETGEDLEKIAGVNFLTPEITFSLKAEYADEKNIARVAQKISKMNGVEEVASPDSEMIDNMNTNIETLSIVLGVIALVMIVISIVLINNTVRLTIYSRRFTIHTMQLVGATRGFIRRPFVVNNILAGVLAAAIASAVLAAAVAASESLDIPGLRIDWGVFAIIAAALVVIGVGICALSASLATTKYLRKNYDELFRA